MIESELKRGKGCVGSCFSDGAVDGWPDKGAAQRAKSKGHHALQAQNTAL